MMVSGFAGSGLKEFGMTAPSPLLVSCSSIEDAAYSKYIDTPYVKVNSEEDLFELKNLLEGSPEEVKERFGFEIDTLVFDSIDSFQRILVDERLASERKKEMGPADWGWMSQKLHDIFTGLSDLNMHIVYLVGAKYEIVDEVFLIRPAIQGAFADQIGEYLHIAARIETINLIEYPQNVPNYTSDILNPNNYQFTVNTMNTYTSTTGVPVPLPPVTTTALAGNTKTYRFLVTRPTQESRWIFDRLEILPDIWYFDPTDEEEYDGVVDIIDLYETNIFATPPSKDQVIVTDEGLVEAPEKEEKATPEMEGQLTITPCSNEGCDHFVESQDWIDLSSARFNQVLCRSCFMDKK
jgi:hypothetical protein